MLEYVSVCLTQVIVEDVGYYYLESVFGISVLGLSLIFCGVSDSVCLFFNVMSFLQWCNFCLFSLFFRFVAVV